MLTPTIKALDEYVFMAMLIYFCKRNLKAWLLNSFPSEPPHLPHQVSIFHGRVVTRNVAQVGTCAINRARAQWTTIVSPASYLRAQTHVMIEAKKLQQNERERFLITDGVFHEPKQWEARIRARPHEICLDFRLLLPIPCFVVALVIIYRD